MRDIIQISLVIGSLIMIATTPVQAVGTRYPYCLQGRTSPGFSNCNFANIAQCRAMASGRRLTCVSNPFYRSRHR
jgi:Protein of unknown function (DUF3551)